MIVFIPGVYCIADVVLPLFAYVYLNFIQIKDFENIVCIVRYLQLE